MSFPRYPAYKDSGVEWLGMLPAHWYVTKVKALTSRISSGKTPLGGSETYVDEGVLFLRSQNVYDDGLRLDDAVFISEATDESMAVSRVQSGDVLLNITGASIGRSCIVPADFQPANVNQHVCAIRPKSSEIGPFLSWLFKSHPIKSQIDLAQNGAAREGLNFEQIGNMQVPIAPPDEQAKLTAFLDRETAKIDALVAEQEQLITLLKEKRQAVISHAVTKGLDPSVPMKDSGVEWLGEVPEHWEVVRVKHLVKSFEQGWSPQCENFPVESESDWGVLKVGCVNGGIFNPEENKALPPDLTPLPELGISAGDLLISRANTRELVGSAAVPSADHHNLMLCDKLYRLRLDPDLCLPAFLSLFLGTERARGQIELAATGASSSMLNISQATILEMCLALPPIAEQQALLQRAGESTTRLEQLMKEAVLSIELLRERRSALISAAVTGQIDVRGLAPALEQAA